MKLRRFNRNAGYSGTDPLGCTNRAGGSPLTDGSFFLHRKAGVLELRKRVRPDGAERFSLTFSGGFAVCGRRERCRAPRLGQKGRDTCGFPSSLNSYLSLI